MFCIKDTESKFCNRKHRITGEREINKRMREREKERKRWRERERKIAREREIERETE